MQRVVFEDDFDELKSQITPEIEEYFEFLNSLNFSLKMLKVRDESACKSGGSE
jgi:hypothetical protein